MESLDRIEAAMSDTEFAKKMGVANSLSRFALCI
jgi:hypothetical protein